MIMKKNKSLLLLLSVVLFGCSKNALFHVKDARESDQLRYYNDKGVEPIFIDPSESIGEPVEPIHSIDTTGDDSVVDDTMLIPATQNSTFTNPVVSPISANTAPVVQQEPYVFEDFFPYQRMQKTYHQIVNEKNKTTLFFQAFDRHGLNIRDLQKDNLHLSENGIRIENYTLSSERQRFDHKLEIAFAIDTAGSMGKYIDMVKNNIVDFVNELEAGQIDVNLCLVTFRDSVERRCSFFYPDNPLTPQNENVLRFLDTLSRLELHSGYNEYHENVLGGTLAAARNTPWSSGSQRMMILATDALFWIPLHFRANFYNSRPESRNAPEYEAVLNELTENNIQLFALTQDYQGFSKSYFNEHPSLVRATSGLWFNIKTLEERSMQAVFDHIRDQLNIFYKIEYFVEDQEGLNPFLALENRKIDLTANATQNSYEQNIQMEIQNIHSNLPEGASHLLSKWSLNEPDIKKDNIIVTVNGIEKKLEEDFLIEDGQIFFTEPPSNGSEIIVTYELEELVNNIQKHPLNLSSTQREVSNFSLLLNEKEVDQTYFEIRQANDGRFSLYLNDSVFSDEDPFNIRESNGLSISLSYEAI